MSRIILLVILSVIALSRQDLTDNSVDDDENPFAEAAAAILKEQNIQNIGGLVSNFMQSGGAKELGNMLLNKENVGHVVESLGSILGSGGGDGNGINPSILGSVMSMMMSGDGKSKSGGGGLDIGTILSLVGSFAGQAGGTGQNPLETIQMIAQTVSSFIGPEADARARSHQDHAWFLPPFLEKMHVLFDHFMHSDLGKVAINNLGAEKFVRIFQDSDGRWNYDKFVEMLENHSFRRHWIKMVTSRIATIITYLADPVMYKKYITTVQHFINGVLQNQGFPKSTYFDPNRPTETMSALVNYISKTYFGVKISSKQYVRPSVEYFQELLKLARNNGLFAGSSTELSDKLADTINMEFIEPLAKANRAYRFAKKVPECDKYVMCLVNHETPEANPSLPGLSSLLSKGTSLIMSWFLSSQTETPFLTFYAIVMDDTEDCKTLFREKCHDFHLEEMKVTTEYVHNEL